MLSYLSMALIIAKDPEERRRALDHLLKKEKAPLIFFESEGFEAFFQEIETLPFLSKTKAVVLQDLDLLNKEQIERLATYLENPNPWISLYLTTSSLPAQSKLIKKSDPVVRIKEEKPWEKEKRLVEWVIGEATAGGVVLSSGSAQTFVRAVDSQFLKKELEKLICYVGERREITLNDIHAVCTPVHHETLWQLGEAIFAGQTPTALRIGRILLEEGMALFPLIAHVRTQFHTSLKVLTLYHQKGKEAVSLAFPYLKGGLLDKKIAAASSFGFERLKLGLVYLFEIELKAKNSAIDPALLLEILLVKVSNDSISTSEYSRSC
jgi:DNA polymerase III subunit delta